MYFFDSRIRYSEADCEGRLTMDSLLNYFQDCSTFQSEDLGLGVKYMKEQNLVWVLSFWQIVVERYPMIGERVQIGTQPYEFKRFMGCRNFLMQTSEGECLAKANSLWSLLDMTTGRPKNPTDRMLAGYEVAQRLPMEYASRKITLPQNGIFQEAIVVKKHHLDTNHHVNNGQYVNIALDYLPGDFEIGQLCAEYRQQAFLDDVFRPYVAERENGWMVALMDEADKPYAIVDFTRKVRV